MRHRGKHEHGMVCMQTKCVSSWVQANADAVAGQVEGTRRAIGGTPNCINRNFCLTRESDTNG